MDWKKLIDDLTAKGLTQGAIAEKCGVKQSTVSDLYRLPDRSPRFDFGDKLRQLHAQTMRKADRAQARSQARRSSDHPNREGR
jgi:transcriptional regulator with XRE-family HTH domain